MYGGIMSRKVVFLIVASLSTLKCSEHNPPKQRIQHLVDLIAVVKQDLDRQKQQPRELTTRKGPIVSDGSDAKTKYEKK